MQKTYGPDGLVVLSVTLDDYNAKGGDKLRPKVAAFLKDKLQTPFKTVHLDPKEKGLKLLGVKEGKLRADGVPVVFVFNRDGQFILKRPTYDEKEDEKDPVDYDAVEKVVREQTRKK